MDNQKMSLRQMALYLIVAISVVFQLYLALFKPLDPMIMSPVHLILALLVVFLAKPVSKNPDLAWIDAPFFAGILFLLYYVLSETTRLVERVQYVDDVATIDMVACVVCIIILMEAVRRTMGGILFGFIAFFLVYYWVGPWCPGILRFGNPDAFNFHKVMVSFTEVMTMGSDGVYGTPLYTSATCLFYFILFGEFFASCGGGKLLIDIGMKSSNSSSGGPAKAAVISSGLLGMISGSAVANVSTTGVMTIPMMKKVGYQPHQAGAIEAVASTGGQIMPPIMGVGAFIMAEMLGIPYSKVAISAIIPALAYYMSVFWLISLMAKKNDLQRKSAGIDATIKVKDPLLERLYMVIPAFVLVGYIVAGRSLMRSGMMGIFCVLLTNIVSKFWRGGKYYVNVKTLTGSTLSGVKQAANIAIPTAACGIIIGVVIQSGLATRFSAIIAGIGSSNLFLALLVAMLGCMLLGMALPTVAAYLVSVILFVPVLIKLKIPPLPANMFVFYFGIMAQITPPVCLASFTAAGIAGASAMKTGWTGFTYALVAFLVPFVFIYNPAILLIGSTMEIIIQTALLFAGTFLLAACMAGFWNVPLSWPLRILLLIGAFCLIAPELISDFVGLSIGAAVFAYSLIMKKRNSASEV